MARKVIAAMGLVLGIGVLLSSDPAAQTSKAAPTFNRDIAAILYRSCAECHRPNQIAPMSLLSYQEARPWARAIKTKVTSREMPPWFADPHYGKFKNDKSLSQEEIEKISAWVDAGAPQGTGAAPAAPRFAERGWSHPSGRPPDLVIEFPVDWHINATGEMPNFNLYTPLPFKEGKYVSATQVLPGNFSATHHITTAVVNMPPGTVLGRGPAWPGGPVTDYVPVAAEKGVTVDNTGDAAVVEDEDDGGGFGAYIPGAGARVARPGQARLIRGDRFHYVRWNLHYQATGQPETARPAIGVWWENSGTVTSVERSLGLREQTSEGKALIADPAKPRNVGIASNVNPFLAPIPANDGNWTLTGINGFQDDATIQAITLHMHLRGKDVTYVLTYPDGREEILLRVPKYDFNWQFQYEFAEPIKVPAGSTIKAIARYDNSPQNRLNPAPHKEVYWSEQSWDDMFLASVRYTVDKLDKKTAATQQGQH
jgi:mono/diheme cytochrome c family protein